MQSNLLLSEHQRPYKTALSYSAAELGRLGVRFLRSYSLYLPAHPDQ